MSKPKPLPDHRHTAVSAPLLNEKYIQEIKDNYSISDEFDLRAQAQRAALHYLSFSSYKAQDTPVSEQRELIKALADRSDSLRECISKLGTNEYSLLDGFDLTDEIDEQLIILEARARRALSRLDGEKSKRGRKPIEEFYYFIQDMHRIFRDATGINLKVTRDPVTGECKSKFLSFLKEFLPYIGIEGKSNETLGRNIQEALKDVAITK